VEKQRRANETEVYLNAPQSFGRGAEEPRVRKKNGKKGTSKSIENPALNFPVEIIRRERKAGGCLKGGGDQRENVEQGAWTESISTSRAK